MEFRMEMRILNSRRYISAAEIVAPRREGHATALEPGCGRSHFCDGPPSTPYSLIRPLVRVAQMVVPSRPAEAGRLSRRPQS